MIEIRHLYKAFDNHMVLRNLNMKINEGAVYGFVGPNRSRQEQQPCVLLPVC